MQSPLVSALIVTYKTPKDAVRCVRALLRQSIAERMEIIVIDNHSEDDSIGILRNTFGKEPSVKLIEAPSDLGYGRGNHRAARQATGEYLLIINPDDELEPTGAERMVAAMRADPTIGILGPQLIHEDGTVRDSDRTFPSLSDIFIKRTFLRKLFKRRMRRYLQVDVDRTVARDVDWLAGACLLMRRDFYERLGGFDPRFFLFFEDTDLCRRARLAGKRVVYFPSVRAIDGKQRLSQGGFFTIFTKQTVRIHLVSAMKYFWKWRS